MTNDQTVHLDLIDALRNVMNQSDLKNEKERAAQLKKIQELRNKMNQRELGIC